jgi:phage tail tape-measure protein
MPGSENANVSDPFGHFGQNVLGDTVYTGTGAYAGASAGAYIGGGVGTVFIPIPGIGTGLGVLVGGFLGGVGGGLVGHTAYDTQVAPALREKVLGKDFRE